MRLDVHNAAATLEREMRMFSVGRVAVAVPAACSIVNLIINRVNSDRWLAYGHQVRLVWHDAQNHITPPPYTGPRGFTPLNLLVSLVSIAAAIVALIWQHRAASAGRALGIPSNQSPAWGVGSWFVPIVNLWIPYLAVRDCLPPEDTHRRLVLHWWLTWLAAGFVGAAAGISAPVLERDRSGAVHPGRRGRPGRDRLGTTHRVGDRHQPPLRHGRAGSRTGRPCACIRAVAPQVHPEIPLL